MDKLEYNRNTGWLCQIWTILVAAARLPGMSDDMPVHYAIRAIKHSSLVPVYESTPMAQVHTLGDACWTEIAFLMTVIYAQEKTFSVSFHTARPVCLHLRDTVRLTIGSMHISLLAI